MTAPMKAYGRHAPSVASATMKAASTTIPGSDPCTKTPALHSRRRLEVEGRVGQAGPAATERRSTAIDWRPRTIHPAAPPGLMRRRASQTKDRHRHSTPPLSSAPDRDRHRRPHARDLLELRHREPARRAVLHGVRDAVRGSPARAAGRRTCRPPSSAPSARRRWPAPRPGPRPPRRPRRHRPPRPAPSPTPSPSAASSASCSPISSGSRRSPRGATPRRSASSRTATSRPSARSSAATAARSRSSSATRSWRCGAPRSPTRTTPSGRSGPALDLVDAVRALGPGHRGPGRRPDRRGGGHPRRHRPGDGRRRHGQHREPAPERGAAVAPCSSARRPSAPPAARSSSRRPRTRSSRARQSPVPAWRAVRVVAQRGGVGRTETLEAPFVGRDEELRQLKDLFHATGARGPAAAGQRHRAGRDRQVAPGLGVPQVRRRAGRDASGGTTAGARPTARGSRSGRSAR